MTTLAFSAARSSGVTPWSSAAFTSAPTRRSCSTSSMSSQCAAHRSAVAPSGRATLTSTPSPRSACTASPILVRGGGHQPQVLRGGRGRRRAPRTQRGTTRQRSGVGIFMVIAAIMHSAASRYSAMRSRKRLDLPAQLKQPLGILKRPLDHQFSAAARLPMTPEPVAKRFENLLLHPRMLASVVPPTGQVVAECDTGVDLNLGSRRTTQERDFPGPKVSFQTRHRIGACAVRIREEQPEVVESVAVGEFLTNGTKRVNVAAKTRALK